MMSALHTIFARRMRDFLSVCSALAAASQVEDKLEEIGAFSKDALNDLPECEWRNAVLIFWHMYHQKEADFAATLPGEVDHWRSGANQLATKLLIMGQMLMPQQRWVQPTLAIASLSALVANSLWSHEDETAKSAQLSELILHRLLGGSV